LKEHGKSPNIDTIIESMKNLIEQCKAEGVFDPALDSTMATRLLLSMFSIIITEKAAHISVKNKKFPGLIEELTNSFQIIIRGFAKEGIDRSALNIISS
jgi:hypothetical protein